MVIQQKGSLIGQRGNGKLRNQGIDRFKWAAAFLVVAVHTSPLMDFSEAADFLLTRVFARVAVPFFFMVSGYFLFLGEEGGVASGKKVFRFCRKTAILYGCAMLVYLPINIYAGTLQRWASLSALLKDVLFNGTFYHLWYLPGAILGMAVTWLLVKKLGWRQALFSAAVLYGIGLLGDSYYGLTVQVPGLRGVYFLLFQLFDYTRNGLFFAPLFLMTGAWMAVTDKPKQISAAACWAGFLVSLTLMSVEGLLVHGFDLQRHDSMYFLLWPCMFFLFAGLLSWRERHSTASLLARELQGAPLFLYLVHPAMIVVIRGLARMINQESLLIGNSLAHFIAVSLSSLVVACGLAALVSLLPKAVRHRRSLPPTAELFESDVLSFLKEKPIVSAELPMTDAKKSRAWTEVNLEHLSHNVQVLQRKMPAGCRLMAVLKADAYGHGAVDVAHHLNKIGICHFAVAAIDEGIDLRKKGITGEILVLGYTPARRIDDLIDYDLCQTLVNAEHGHQLDNCGKSVNVQLKIDTGMNRLGEPYSHTEEIISIFRCQHLKIKGMFSHFGRADSHEEADCLFTAQQEQRFKALLQELREQQFDIPSLHLQSSYGLANYPCMNYDYARVGIALYGAFSTWEEELSLDLKPVLSLKSRVALVKTIQQGESAGYGRSFIAKEKTKIAVIPIGYADGVPRSLSDGKGQVLIGGRRVSVVGSICMDQLIVDVTGLPEVKQDDVVTLIGRDGDEVITVEEMAERAGTIANELLSRLGARVKA